MVRFVLERTLRAVRQKIRDEGYEILADIDTETED